MQWWLIGKKLRRFVFTNYNLSTADIFIYLFLLYCKPIIHHLISTASSLPSFSLFTFALSSGNTTLRSFAFECWVLLSNENLLVSCSQYLWRTFASSFCLLTVHQTTQTVMKMKTTKSRTIATM